MLGLNFVITPNDAIPIRFYVAELFRTNKTVFVKMFRALRKLTLRETGYDDYTTINPQNTLIRLLISLEGLQRMLG